LRKNRIKGPFEAALEKLNIEYEEGDLEISGYNGIQAKAQIRIATSDPDYQIGFRKSGDHYELIADWYGIKYYKEREFINMVTQKYAFLVALSKLEEQGFTLVEEAREMNNRIHLTVRRMT
jgi:hypothetical protein